MYECKIQGRRKLKYDTIVMFCHKCFLEYETR
jgi:hypothetical protein